MSELDHATFYVIAINTSACIWQSHAHRRKKWTTFVRCGIWLSQNGLHCGVGTVLIYMHIILYINTFLSTFTQGLHPYHAIFNHQLYKIKFNVDYIELKYNYSACNNIMLQELSITFYTSLDYSIFLKYK